jgi:hypothetical protein
MSREVSYENRYLIDNEKKKKIEKNRLKRKWKKFSMERKSQEYVAECRRYGKTGSKAYYNKRKKIWNQSIITYRL